MDNIISSGSSSSDPSSIDYSQSLDAADASPRTPPSPLQSSLSTESTSSLTSFDDLDQLIFQQFSNSQTESGNQEEYLAQIQIPQLASPSTGLLPLEAGKRLEAMQLFKDKVKEELQNKVMLESGSVVVEGSPQEKKLQDKVNVDFKRIMESVVKGKEESLSHEDAALVKKATKETRQARALPDTWFFGTTDEKAWIPTEEITEMPAGLNHARMDVLTSNFSQLIASLEKGVRAVGKANGTGQSDVFLQLLNALSRLKELLGTLQMKDAETMRAATDAKVGLAQLQQQSAVDSITDMMKKWQEEAEAKKKQALMGILGPVISGVLAVVTVLVTVATAGTMTAPLIALCVVAVAMFAYSVADSQLGLSGKLMEKMADLGLGLQILVGAVLLVVIVAAIVASGGSGLMSVLSQAAQTALKVTAAVVLPIAMTVLMSSGVLSNIVVESLIQSGAIDGNDEDLINKIKMGVMIGSSLILVAVIAGPSIKQAASALATKVSNLVKDIATTVRTVFYRASEQVALRVMQGAMQTAQQAAEAAAAATQSVVEAEKAIEGVKSTIQNLRSEIAAAQNNVTKVSSLTKQLENAQGALSQLEQDLPALKDLQRTAQEASQIADQVFLEKSDAYFSILSKISSNKTSVQAQAVDEIAQAAQEATKRISEVKKPITLDDIKKAVVNAFKDFMTGFKKLMPENVRELAPQITTVMSIGNDSLAIYNGIYLGNKALDLAKLEREIGDSEEMIALIQTLVDILTKLIALYQQGGDRNMAWADEITLATQETKSSWARTIEKLMQG